MPKSSIICHRCDIYIWERGPVTLNKKYLIITISLFVAVGICTALLFITDSVSYSTMFSIFIPILVGTIINYDLKQKEIYLRYYEAIYRYIVTYHDILSQPFDRLTMEKKHDMIKKLSRDMTKFLNDNLEYASENVCEILEINFLYEYENYDNQNEYQDVYNLNRLIPILCNEIIEIYNVLYFNHFVFRKIYLKKEEPHKSSRLIYNYVDSVLINAAQKEMAFNLYELNKFYQMLLSYRRKNYKKYFKIYSFLKKNKKLNNDEIIDFIDENFGFKILDYKKR